MVQHDHRRRSLYRSTNLRSSNLSFNYKLSNYIQASKREEPKQPSVVSSSPAGRDMSFSFAATSLTPALDTLRPSLAPSSSGSADSIYQKKAPEANQNELTSLSLVRATCFTSPKPNGWQKSLIILCIILFTSRGRDKKIVVLQVEAVAWSASPSAARLRAR
jgi:hypothetical protein